MPLLLECCHKVTYQQTSVRRLTSRPKPNMYSFPTCNFPLKPTSKKLSDLTAEATIVAIRHGCVCLDGDGQQVAPRVDQFVCHPASRLADPTT